MEFSCSVAGDCALLLAEEKYGALMWVSTVGRGWQLTYERYDAENSMLAMVHRRGLIYKATVFCKAEAVHLSTPWWVEAFVGGEYEDRIEAIGRAEVYIARWGRTFPISD